MIKSLKKIFSCFHLEETLQRERVESARAELDFQRREKALEEQYQRHLDLQEQQTEIIKSSYEERITVIREYHGYELQRLQAQVTRLQNDYDLLHDRLMTVMGVTPLREPLRPHYEPEPERDDAGPIGAQILQRDEEEFNKYMAQKLGMAQAPLTAMRNEEHPAPGFKEN